MKRIAYLFLVILVLGSWGYLNSEWLVDRVSTSPIVKFWNGEDLEYKIAWDRPYNRTLHPLKPMHDPEPIIAYAPAPPPPAPAPVESRKYAMVEAESPSPVKMPIVEVVATPIEKKIWDNPLINSLVIPLALYFGKKWIDLFFARMEKAHAS